MGRVKGNSTLWDHQPS